MKDLILITGTVMTADGSSVEVYQRLVDICKKITENVSSPIDTMNFKGNEVERYARAMELMSKTKVVIAEMSVPSTGQGMELQEAVNLNIPIIVLAKIGSKVSGLVKGCGKVKDILYYEDIKEIEQRIVELVEAELK